jgi:hypothetical protein
MVTKLTGTEVDTTMDGSYVIMRNSSSFFDFDGVDYKWSGQVKFFFFNKIEFFQTYFILLMTKIFMIFAEARKRKAY